jgi:hypothetical protein
MGTEDRVSRGPRFVSLLSRFLIAARSLGIVTGMLLAGTLALRLSAAAGAPIARWVADDWAGGTANWVDRVGGKEATSYGEPVKTAGQFNVAASDAGIVFDGVNDYFEVDAANNPIAGRTKVTIVALFKATQGATGNDNGGLFWEYPGPINAESPEFPNDFGLTIGADGLAHAFFNISFPTFTPISVVDGLVHTMILTWSDPDNLGDGVASFYVDGVLAGLYPVPDGGNGIVNDLIRFGRERETVDRWFRGTIGELRFYETIENPAEVHSSMTGTSQPPTQIPVTVIGALVNNKVYDGSTIATLNPEAALLSGVALGDDVSLDTVAATASFASPSAGSKKLVNVSGLALSGPDASKYVLVDPTVLEADITPKPLDVTGFSVLGRTFDATRTAALVVSNPQLIGILDGDVVTLNSEQAAGLFDTSAVGLNKPVLVTDLALEGKDAANYQWVSPSITASINSDGLTAGTLVAVTSASLGIGVNGEVELVQTSQLPAGALVERVVLSLEYSTFWSAANNPAIAGNYVKLNGLDLPGLGWVSIGTDNAWQGVQAVRVDALGVFNRSGQNLWRIGSAWNPVSLQNLTVTIHYWVPNQANQAPTDIALSASSLAENNAANATVGTLTATDVDAGSTHTFTLVSGTGDTDNAAFNLIGNALRLTGSADFEAKSSYSVRVRATDAGGLFFEKAFAITVTDVNEAPTISTISGQTTAEDTATSAIAFTVGDVETAAGSLTVTATSSDLGVVAAGGIALGGSGASRTITLTPMANASGTSTITVTVTDGGSLTATRSFVLTVTAVNDTPTISMISDQTTLEDTATGAIAFTVGDVETPVGSLTVTATSSNLGVVAAGGIALGGSEANRTITLTPVANASGTSTITVTVTDASGLTATRSFVLTVTAVNDAPTISTISDQTTLEDTATGAIAFTVGDVETAAGLVTVTATSSNVGVVAAGGIALGGSEANRTITLSPVANASGTSTITVTVTDASGLTATRSFVLTVTAVNDTPTISTISDQTTLEDTATGAIAFTVGDVETAAGSLAVTATSSNVGVVAADGIALGGSGANRMITLSPVANASGTSTITVTVTDGGSLTATRSFALTVTAAVELLVNPQFALLDPVNPLKPLAWDSTEGWVVFSGSGGNDAPPAVVANGLTDRFLTFGRSSSVVVSQTVPVFPMTSSGVDSFSLAYEVVKNQQEGIYWVQAEFLDASGTVLATLRRPSSGTEAAPSALTANQLVLNRDSLANFDQITQVRVSLFGQQSPYVWGGHYGPFFNYVSLTAVLLPNTAPTITAISGQTTAEDTATSAIAFTVGDVETAVGSLTVTATSSNVGVLAAGGIALGGSGAERMITLSPVANASGTSTITVTVTDAGGASATNSFVLIVTPVPDVPTLEGFLLGAGLMPVVGGDGRYRLEASLGQAIAGSLPKVGSLDLASGFWFLDRLANALPGQLGDIPTPAQAAKGLMLQRATVAASRTDRLSSGTAPQMASGVRLLEARIRVAAVGDTAKVRILVSGLPKARLRVQSREGFGTGSWRDDGILQLDGEGEGFLETSGGDVSAMRFYRLVQP